MTEVCIVYLFVFSGCGNKWSMVKLRGNWGDNIEGGEEEEVDTRR